jgi:4-amino-4-deoxy-L-arabinose transferase-like glycosyltransferase
MAEKRRIRQRMAGWAKYLPILYGVGFAVILLFCLLYTFWGLAEAPLFDWDEARHGVSAYEMVKSGNYLAQTYLGEVDYWNLKPPLAFWGIALPFRLFGVSALTFRLCSALSLAVVVAVFMLCAKKPFGVGFSLLGGFLFAVVGVQMNHLFLHGDADALFYLFCFLSILFFFKAMTEWPMYLLGTSLAFAGAFLTKAAHAVILVLILAPVLLLFWREHRLRLRELLVYGLLPAAVPVVIWGVFRYRYDGLAFFEGMLFRDILARASSELEGNARGWTYYFAELRRVLGLPLLLLGFLALLLAVVLFVARRSRLDFKDRAWLALAALTTLIPLVIYSLMTTKLSWYVWPATIGFVFLLAWFPGFFYRNHRKATKVNRKASLWRRSGRVFCCLLLLSLLRMPNHRQIQWYYDASNLYPIESIFQHLPPTQEMVYVVVGEDGGQGSLPQSWVLDGIFRGYEFQWGTQADFGVLTLVYKSKTTIPLLVAPENRILAETDTMAVLEHNG